MQRVYVWVTGALYVYFKTAKMETQQNTWGKRHKVGISYHPLAKLSEPMLSDASNCVCVCACVLCRFLFLISRPLISRPLNAQALCSIIYETGT